MILHNSGKIGFIERFAWWELKKRFGHKCFVNVQNSSKDINILSINIDLTSIYSEIQYKQ